MLFNGKLAAAYYRARHPWASVEAVMRAAVDVLRAQVGPEARLACVGFCWGGWAVVRACGMDARLFACGAALHPAPDLQRLQADGPTRDAMLLDVKVPLFLAPADSDSTYLRPDAWWLAFLNEAGKPTNGSESFLYADQRHGWSNRGDIRDPLVKGAVDQVVAQLGAFLDKHLR